MGGASLAFKTFRYDCGVLGSPWCGFEKIVFQFPIPIIIAILINEIKNEKSKKFFQTVFTFQRYFH